LNAYNDNFRILINIKHNSPTIAMSNEDFKGYIEILSFLQKPLFSRGLSVIPDKSIEEDFYKNRANEKEYFNNFINIVIGAMYLLIIIIYILYLHFNGIPLIIMCILLFSHIILSIKFYKIQRIGDLILRKKLLVTIFFLNYINSLFLYIFNVTYLFKRNTEKEIENKDSLINIENLYISKLSILLIFLTFLTFTLLLKAHKIILSIITIMNTMILTFFHIHLSHNLLLEIIINFLNALIIHHSNESIEDIIRLNFYLYEIIKKLINYSNKKFNFLGVNTIVFKNDNFKFEKNQLPNKLNESQGRIENELFQSNILKNNYNDLSSMDMITNKLNSYKESSDLHIFYDLTQYKLVANKNQNGGLKNKIEETKHDKSDKKSLFEILKELNEEKSFNLKVNQKSQFKRINIHEIDKKTNFNNNLKQIRENIGSEKPYTLKRNLSSTTLKFKKNSDSISHNSSCKVLKSQMVKIDYLKNLSLEESNNNNLHSSTNKIQKKITKKDHATVEIKFEPDKLFETNQINFYSSLGIYCFFNKYLNKNSYNDIYFKKYKIKDETFTELIFKDVSVYFEANLKINEEKESQKQIGKLIHEFKTPLNAIIGLISQINTNNILNNNNEIAVVNGLSNYLLFLVNDLINFTNPEQLESINYFKERINIKSILEFCLNILNALLICKESHKNIKTSIKYDEIIDSLFVESDEIRVKQILLNYISNSVKFTKAGKIFIESEVNQIKQLIKISVIDTGIGIRDEDKHKVFQDNIQKNSSIANQLGSGFGLSISKFLAEKLNIKLKFKSAYGKGSCFSLKIPYNIENLYNSDNSHNSPNHIPSIKITSTKTIENLPKADENALKRMVNKAIDSYNSPKGINSKQMNSELSEFILMNDTVLYEKDTMIIQDNTILKFPYSKINQEYVSRDSIISKINNKNHSIYESLIDNTSKSKNYIYYIFYSKIFLFLIFLFFILSKFKSNKIKKLEIINFKKRKLSRKNTDN